jgi:predicted Fe-Mo cluster-binding NifX family protein
MRIAIPVADGKLCAHFGHCETFAIVDVEGREIKEKKLLTPPPHEPGVLPRWLHENGAGVVIAGGMGARAQALFAENDIKVIVGAESLPPEDIVRQYVSGTLLTGDNVCDH